MTRNPARIVTALLILLGLPLGAGWLLANSYLPRTDLEFIAVRVADGHILWSYKPDKMGDAHCEVFKDLVVLFPDHPQRSREKFIVLDRKTGAPAKGNPMPDAAPLARSAVFFTRFPLVTKSGLELRSFSEGNTKDLAFSRPGKSEPEAVIREERWPNNLCLWNDTIIYDRGMYEREAVIYAYDVNAPGKPAWTLDLNRHITGSLEPDVPAPGVAPTPGVSHVPGHKTRMQKAVLDGKLYVNAEEHLFCVDPEKGAILWQRDMAADLGLKFVPDFFNGGLNIAPMAKDGDVLIVAFENRVIAFDVKKQRVLWHLMPDTFPHTPFPAIHDGVVYMNAGSKWKLEVPADPGNGK